MPCGEVRHAAGFKDGMTFDSRRAKIKTHVEFFKAAFKQIKKYRFQANAKSAENASHKVDGECSIVNEAKSVGVVLMPCLANIALAKFSVVRHEMTGVEQAHMPLSHPRCRRSIETERL